MKFKSKSDKPSDAPNPKLGRPGIGNNAEDSPFLPTNLPSTYLPTILPYSLLTYLVPTNHPPLLPTNYKTILPYSLPTYLKPTSWFSRGPKSTALR